MTILYKANETDFTHFGLGPLNDAVSILVTEERNGIFELEMKYPVSGGRFEDLKNDRIIKADAGHNLKDQRFKIIRITKPLKGIVTVHAEHASYLSQDLALKPKVAFSGNAQQALSTWKANLIDDNPFIVSSDITTTSSGMWTIDEVENPRRALGGVSGSILDKYGGEYRFDNYQIRLMRQRGVNSAALIAYGRNLTELTQEEEIANTYTSIYPYSIYRDDDGNEHLLTLPEFYIDSEHVNNFARRKVLAVDFSQDEIKTVTALRSAANTYITANSVGVPKVNLKMSYVDLTKTLDYKKQALLEEVNLCDNVPVYFEKFGINKTAKVIKVVWDDIRKQYDSVEIGEARSGLTQAINTTVDGRVSHVEKKVNIIQLQADGMKLIYRQVDRPPNGSHVGDLWYQPNGIYEIMYQWDGSDWKEILNTQDLDAIKREVDAAIAQAEEAKKEAEQAYNDAVTEAERLVSAQSEAFDAQMAGVTQEINTVKSNIDTAISNVNQEIANNFTSLSDSISEVGSIADQAKADAQTGIMNAATALSQAQSAISQLGGLSGKITSVEQDIDDINGVLSTKVSTTEFNSLSGTVTNLSTTQTQQAGLIAQKANQSTVDTLAGRVSTAEGQITTQAGQIALRVTEVQAKSIADSAVDGLEIGGRNLAKKINFRFGYYDSLGNWNVSAEGSRNQTTEAIDVAGASQITISQYDIIPDYPDGARGRIWAWDADRKRISLVMDAMMPDEWASPNSKTVNLPVGTAYITATLIWLTKYKWKIEKGNKATDWTPAPEDTIELISSVSSELSIEKDKITQLLTRTSNNETAINQVKSTADGTKQTVANHTGKITTLETNVNGLQATVADKVSSAQFTVLSNSVSSVVSDFNNLEIGGRNLLKYSNNASMWNTSTYQLNKVVVQTTLPDNTTGEVLEIGALESGRGYLRFPYANMELNEEYTFSFWVKRSTSGSRLNISVNINGEATASQEGLRVGANQDWQRISVTRKVTRELPVYGFIELRPQAFTWSGTARFYIWRPQLEKGNKATDWSPAPEDQVTQTQFTQTVDNFNARIVEKGNVVAQFNMDNGTTLISNKKILLDANTYIMGTTFVTDLKAKSIEAVTANITSIRSQVLITDSVTSTHIKADTALINSIFATTALITTLTSKAAFITNIQAITISADKVTTGTLNAANVNIINLNVSKIVGLNSTFIQSQWNLLDATTSITGTGLVSQQGVLSTRLTGGEIATVSGTKTGKINALGMEIYDSSNGQTTRLHSDGLEFNWYGIKRVFEQNSEGVTIRPITGSGNRLNSSLHITTGSGADKVAYVEFTNATSGNGGRIILQGLGMGIRHPAGGVVQIANYANDGRLGNLRAGTFQTSTYDGRGLRIAESQINTLADNQTIFLMPSGTGELRVGTGGGSPSLWPVRASRFVEGSSRESKTNIKPYVGSALEEINKLQAVTFNRKEDLLNGIDYTSLGFIAEDSPSIAIRQPAAPLGVDHYKMVTLAIKGVQELNNNIINLSNRVNLMDHRFVDEINEVRTISNNALTKTEELEKRIEELENEVKLLKGA